MAKKLKAVVLTEADPKDMPLSTGVSTGVVEMPDVADRVGSVEQKEKAAYDRGLTRAKYIGAINELLEAERAVVVTNEYGAQSTLMVPDLDKRAKGAELAGKFFGDYKEQSVVGNVTHNKIVYQWLSAPNAAVVGNRV